MAGTRSSARLASNASLSSKPMSEQPSPTPGDKRKGRPTGGPKSKKTKKGDEKEQTTIEESMGVSDGPEEANDVEMKEDDRGEAEDDHTKKNAEEPEQAEEQSKLAEASEQRPEANGDSKANGSAQPQEGASNSKDSSIKKSAERKEAVASSILEKGIIYFFFRGRVNVDDPSSPDDIARSYIVLRPMPHGSKLGDGPIDDSGKNRLLALPKKVLPKSPKDRFMTFVEKANASVEDIKTQLSSSDYATKTAGTRHTPAAAPFGEGVYALTKTGRNSHLAYSITIPSQIDEVQEEIGLRQQGSYLVTAKNPTQAAPANASLPQGPEYPQEILDEFHGRGWMPLQPKLLDYENTQFLLIGHGDDALGKATAPQPDDQEKGKEEPKEEMEKLEHEDEMRVENLKGDDSIFVDLNLSSKEYPKLQTTW